jgi:hypothetical protein
VDFSSCASTTHLFLLISSVHMESPGIRMLMAPTSCCRTSAYLTPYCISRRPLAVSFTAKLQGYAPHIADGMHHLPHSKLAPHINVLWFVALIMNLAGSGRRILDLSYSFPLQAFCLSILSSTLAAQVFPPHPQSQLHGDALPPGSPAPSTPTSEPPHSDNNLILT